MRQRRIVLGVVLGVVATALVVAVLLALPAQPQVACPPFVGPRGPATHTDGPLAITTDASVYASDGVLTVTVTSHLGNPIYLFTSLVFQAQACNGVELERLGGAGWQEADQIQCNYKQEAAPPPFTGLPERLLPGQEGGERIDLTGTLAPGTYRYIARYILADPSKPNLLMEPYVQSMDWVPIWETATRVFSPPFQVCACASCP